MQKITLGGERLGSGKKMKVELKNYERSTHDLGYIWRSTMAAGTLVPFMTEVALPGDTFDINLDIDIKTHPTIGPLFGSYKVQADIFLAPIRLYQGQLHNNKLGIGNHMDTVKLPQIEIESNAINRRLDPDNQQINPSCIFSYLNIRGVGGGIGVDGKVLREFNAVPYLAYWDTYKNYYANKQEEKGAVIHAKDIIRSITEVKDVAAEEKIPENTGNANLTIQRSLTLAVSFTGERPESEDFFLRLNTGELKNVMEIFDVKAEYPTYTTYASSKREFSGKKIQYWRYADVESERPPKIKTFPLKNLDDMRENILIYTKQSSPFTISKNTNLEPYNLPLLELGTGTKKTWTKLTTQEGLAIKTYQSDLFNNWMQSEWIDGENGINAITAIDTSDGNFSIDTFQLATKVYEMLNRIAISGGTYDDWQRAVYMHDRVTLATTPMYMGGLIKELVFQEVISNAEAGDGEQPLGTLAGRGVMAGKRKGGHVTIKVDEPSYIMGIISLTPRVDYSQGNKWDTNLKTMDDFHKPALDQIGFQDLITDQMAAFDTTITLGNPTKVEFRSAGKQPAWLNYMTNVNQTRGNFAVADNEMFMTLNRRYEMDGATGQIKDLTTYIDPIKFNHIFAQTSRDAQNFWAQIGVDITARRKMSAKIMPNL